MIPLFECLKCGDEFEGFTLVELAEKKGIPESELADMRRKKACLVKSGPHIFCLICNSIYVKWLNYKD